MVCAAAFSAAVAVAHRGSSTCQSCIALEMRCCARQVEHMAVGAYRRHEVQAFLVQQMLHGELKAKGALAIADCLLKTGGQTVV